MPEPLGCASSLAPSAAATDVARLVAAGEVSAVEIACEHLARIERVDRILNALVHIDTAGALRQARRVDRRRARGYPAGPLAGVPFVVKDNIDVRGQWTSCGSFALPRVSAARHALLVERLVRAGAVLLGRANMDELAMGSSTATSAYGQTRNPWDTERSPGGSSGGPAAAVAAGLAMFSVGTDTGGSIREPAAHCGLVGLAPTPGTLPICGVAPFVAELDRVGPIARTVADATLVLAVAAGWPCPAVASPAAPRALRIGVVREQSGPHNSAAVRAALGAVCDALTRSGHTVVDVSVPSARQTLFAYMIITSAACVPAVEPLVRAGLVGPEVTRRWALGRSLRDQRRDLLAEALAVRDRVRAEARDALTGCDALLSPTTPATAPLLRSGAPDGLLDDAFGVPDQDCWTTLASLAGLPAVSVPAGADEDGMPIGAMITANTGADAVLLGLASRIGECVPLMAR